MPIQWIIIALAVFAVGQAWRSLAAGSLDRRKFLLWSAFWAAVAVVVLRPEVTSVLARWLGVGRGVDMALYLSVALLFYALFRVSRKVDRLERGLTALVRQIALQNAARPTPPADDRKQS